MKMKFWLLLVLIFLGGFSTIVSAGNPLVVDKDRNNGYPARWPYDAVKKKYVVHWRVDDGPLTDGSVRVSSEIAVRDWIKPLFNTWQTMVLNLPDGSSVPAVSLEFIYDGKIGKDITVEKYEEYIDEDKVNPKGYAVIIFDPDGSIIADYFHDDGDAPDSAKNNIVGFAGAFYDSARREIRAGYAVLNGRVINGTNAANDKEIDTNVFKALILHELGHLLNLDHTQLNWDVCEECVLGEDCPGGEACPTLYPTLNTIGQRVLHRDDKVTLGWLYPSREFKEKFCVIKGDIQDEDGRGQQGVNVVGKNIDNDLLDARSWVSGALYKEHTRSGEYILSGIVPGEDYEVGFEPLLKKYNDPEKQGRWIGPLGPDSPTGFPSGTILGPNDSRTVKCDRGGDVIEMPPIKVYRGMPGSDESDLDEDDTPIDDEKKKKGWFCSLNPENQDMSLAYGWGVILFSLISLRWVDFKRHFS